MMRKWMGVLLILALLISVRPVQTVSADGTVEKLPTMTIVNPEYADILPAEDITQIAPPQYGKLDFGEGYLPVEEAAVQVREGLKRRETAIPVNFYTTETDPNVAVSTLFESAMLHTGNPTEGDYLKKQYHACSINGYVSQGTVDGVAVTQLEITYTVTYMTDAAQEAEMDAAVAALLASLDLDCTDDYTKFITVYDYICDNVTYDYDNLHDGTYLLKHSAYAALVNKTAVCQGYAVLLYRLMLELGIDCRYISGDSGGAHGWNIVKLDGKYYNADSTWDAGYSNYRWCLLSQENFVNHTRDAEFDTAAFHSAYPMGATNYTYTGNGVSNHSYTAVVILPTCTAQGYTTYTCQRCNDSYTADYKAPLEHNYVDGVCTACQDVQIVYGDATGDGIVNGQDLIRLKKYIANYNYETGVSTVAIAAGADATGDGIVNGQDLIRLKKYIANFNYETGESTVPLGPQ